MEKYDVKFKKSFGQNFLRDSSVVDKIVGLCDITDKDLVIEVGPGGAILTKKLASVSKNVLAYEIDKDLENELVRKLEGYNNVNILSMMLRRPVTTSLSFIRHKSLTRS